MGYPTNDKQYEDVILESVEDSKEGYTLGFHQCTCFYVPKPTPIVPQKGMIARFYPGGLGFIVRGLFLDGVKVFYRSEQEQKAQNLKDIEDDKTKRQQELDSKRGEYNKRIKCLPSVFQRRIQKFQDTNQFYDRDYGFYELFTCEQAVIIADCFKTIEAIDDFSKQDWKHQKELCPALGEGHSGNTLGFAKLLAKLYLTDPKGVILEHGALTPLVGCKDYGCPHPFMLEGYKWHDA